MDKLFEKREYILRFYTKYSKYVDKAFQFALALLTFVFINNNVGFMKTVSNPIVTLGLAVVCTVLPMLFTVVVAVILTLLQFYTLSIGVAGVAAVIFVLMFIFYFRFTPSKTIVLLLMPIAFMLKVPVLIPIVYGLIGTPICMIPVALGTIVYYMIIYVKSYATTIGEAGKTDLPAQITTFVKQLLYNRELWVTVIAFMVCLLIVYSIRRMSVDHSWKIAVITGGITNIVVIAIGNFVMNTHISYVLVIVGSILAVILAMVLEFLVFSLDYSRTEHLQFEDDEYYYYVKAVPKVSMAVPEKTVKRINERQETAAINTDAVQATMKKAKRKSKVSSETKVMEQADEMLLAKTLQEELDIQKIIEDELKY